MRQALARFALGLLLTACSSYQSPSYNGPKYRSPSEPRNGSRADGDIDIGSDAASLESPSLPPPSSTLMLSWPLKGAFHLSRGFMLGGRPHQGLDLVAPKGNRVRSAHAGYVEYAGHDFSGYGNLVIINAGNRWSTFYAHLNRIRVREGQSIKRGQQIGDVGATGNARGVHLHFELRYNQSPVDPMQYLP